MTTIIGNITNKWWHRGWASHDAPVIATERIWHTRWSLSHCFCSFSYWQRQEWRTVIPITHLIFDTHRKLFYSAFIGILQSLQFSKIDNTGICCGLDVYAFPKYLYVENASTYVPVFGDLACMEALKANWDHASWSHPNTAVFPDIKKRDLWLTMWIYRKKASFYKTRRKFSPLSNWQTP